MRRDQLGIALRLNLTLDTVNELLLSESIFIARSKESRPLVITSVDMLNVDPSSPEHALAAIEKDFHMDMIRHLGKLRDYYQSQLIDLGITL